MNFLAQKLGYSGFPVKKSCTMKDLAWRTATKIRMISRKDAKAAKKQNKFPNLAFLAPWREEYPNPIKICASHEIRNQGDNARSHKKA